MLFISGAAVVCGNCGFSRNPGRQYWPNPGSLPGQTASNIKRNRLQDVFSYTCVRSVEWVIIRELPMNTSAHISLETLTDIADKRLTGATLETAMAHVSTCSAL